MGFIGVGNRGAGDASVHANYPDVEVTALCAT